MVAATKLCLHKSQPWRRHVNAHGCIHAVTVPNAISCQNLTRHLAVIRTPVITSLGPESNAVACLSALDQDAESIRQKDRSGCVFYFRMYLPHARLSLNGAVFGVLLIQMTR